MICPACGERHFASAKLDAGLPAQRCDACHGVWVDLDSYRIWRKNTPDLPVPLAGDIHLAQVDDAVRMCPQTGRMMTRIRVSHDNPLRLDFSAVAQGVWLDSGEWESLCALGLHRQLDAIVSERWQHDVQHAASRERISAAQRARFGDAAYDELLRVRAWLRAQPNAAEMYAFLNARGD